MFSKYLITWFSYNSKASAIRMRRDKDGLQKKIRKKIMGIEINPSN